VLIQAGLASLTERYCSNGFPTVSPAVPTDDEYSANHDIDLDPGEWFFMLQFNFEFARKGEIFHHKNLESAIRSNLRSRASS
jgi:hypothetical protein